MSSFSSSSVGHDIIHEILFRFTPEYSPPPVALSAVSPLARLMVERCPSGYVIPGARIVCHPREHVFAEALRSSPLSTHRQYAEVRSGHRGTGQRGEAFRSVMDDEAEQQRVEEIAGLSAETRQIEVYGTDVPPALVMAGWWLQPQSSRSAPLASTSEEVEEPVDGLLTIPRPTAVEAIPLGLYCSTWSPAMEDLLKLGWFSTIHFIAREQTTDLAWLQLCCSHQLQEIVIQNAVNVEEVPEIALAAASSLRVLRLRNCGVCSVEPVALCSELRELCVTWCEDLHALPPSFTLDHLVSLDLTGTPITDVAPFAKCPELRYLCLNYCKGLQTIAPLTATPQLRVLHAKHTTIREIGTYPDTSPLEEVDLSQSPNVESVAGLAPLPSLQVLRLRYCKVTDLGGMDRCERLRVLDLTGCQKTLNDTSKLVMRLIEERIKELSPHAPPALVSLLKSHLSL